MYRYYCIKLFSSIHFFQIFPLKESVRPWHKTCLSFAVSQKKPPRCQCHHGVCLSGVNFTSESDSAVSTTLQSLTFIIDTSQGVRLFFFIRNKCKNVFKIYLRSIQLFFKMNHGTKWTEIKKEEIFLKINAFFHSEGSMT